MEDLDVPFAIEETSGELFTTNFLDRETVAIYRLTVIGSDKHPTQPLSSSVLVTVLIGDINDHWPQFMDSPYVAYMPTGLAPDPGTPSLTSHTEITFEITGRNQFAPSFSKPHVIFSVPEDLPVGSVIGKIQAEDGDYGPNGAIMYCITPENLYLPLSVGDVSGLLTLIKELDFEKESTYYFQIKAKDGGWVSKTGMVDVTVTVMDVNDNPPVFSSSEYTTSVPENSEIGTNVLHVTATDNDSGTNTQISYSLIAGHVDKFAIDSRNGTITTLVVFDYEQEHIFDITIKASNTGGPTLFSLAHVVIQISDVNEFTPKFKKKEFNFSVFKNVSIGTLIGKVTATDYDQGSEGQVFYLMFGQSKSMGFEVDKLSGEIHTTNSLRKQGNSHVVLKVLAKNPGVITGMDIDETLVRISVIDTNDPPTFISTLYVANVLEDSPAGTSVVTVSAEDQDSVLDWNRFFFSIENGNTNFAFAVDLSSGLISVNSSLDRELWPVYNLTVTATDNGSPPATGTTTVIVTIGDVNDNAPKLISTEAQVKENQPEGTVVIRLNASDSDLPPNQGPFTYWLLNPSTVSAFSLTTDGVLLTTQAVDREQISTYQLLVVVGDAGFPSPLSSTATLLIRVVDENDNPSLPRNIFIEVKYFGSSFQGGMIGNVHPEDEDEDDTFSCTIKSGPANMFVIPNGSCELWSAPFQGEATFNITIEATDQLHFPVNNSIYVNYKGFTNASIDSCILFYVSSSSVEEFLSNKYLRFVKALDKMTEELVLRFNGSDYIEYVIKERFKRDYLIKHVVGVKKEAHIRDQTVINIKFKTKEDGVLMFILGQMGYIMLKIKDRKPVYISKDTLSGHLSELIVDSPVADGVWHVLSLFNKRQSTLLSVDGFSGCVQYFNVTGYTLPISGHSLMVDVWPSSTLTHSSCSSPGVCFPSPCSEEDTTHRTCLSNCQNKTCGPAVQSRSCICLHNVSDYFCDICIDTTEGRDRCSEVQGTAPLWLIAVVLPLISILVITGMLVVLYRVRKWDATCQRESLPQKTEQGTDNMAFCYGDNVLVTDAVSPEKGNQHEPVGVDQGRSSVEFYCDTSLSSAQQVPNSELEYYEIGSISSIN
nr:PREDICTED: protocadherin Fat 4-like [Stegastes partitus]